MRSCTLAAALIAFVPACTSDAPTNPTDQASVPALRSLEGGEWSAPVNLGTTVNSSANDLNGILSKDELSLYFTSDRLGGLGGMDIWVTRRASTEGAWEAPVNLGSPINTPTSDFAPNLSIDGHLLFFSSNRPGGRGNNDIYVSRRANPNDDSGWGLPTNLGPDVNTADAENAPMYLQNAEAGSANLYFNRGVLALAQGDIYYGAITRDGETRAPSVLVTALSSLGVNDAAVSLRHDAKEVFFWSGRPGSFGSTDLWTSTRRNANDSWPAPTNVGATVNSASSEVTPSLSFDGRTLIFASMRPKGLGGNDLWMSTRTRGGEK